MNIVLSISPGIFSSACNLFLNLSYDIYVENNNHDDSDNFLSHFTSVIGHYVEILGKLGLKGTGKNVCGLLLSLHVKCLWNTVVLGVLQASWQEFGEKPLGSKV